MEAALARKTGKAPDGEGATPLLSLSLSLSKDPFENELLNARAEQHARASASASAGSASASASTQQEDKERGGMDNMLAALRSGSAFTRGRPH